MKLQTDKRSLVTVGTKNSEEFKVEATGHMMEILSGLYSDIPWAVVREYGTNMLDGYIALPKDVKVIPPQIHLPTILEPYIEFKDFGIGMDFDTVWKVYKTYGASTKRDNNEEVGGLGLGAKTAFCYEGCESWAIESRFNGKRMIFNATRNEKGIPTLFHVDTLDTKEPSGVTVRIPIAQRDFDQFRRAVSRLVQFYPMGIEVRGDNSFKPVRNEYIVRGKNWAIRRGRDSQVIMGNVPYPLDMAQIFQKFPRMDRAVAQVALDIRVPVGTVDIVPSREALKYTQRTVNRISSYIEEFYAEVGPAASELLDKQETEWDALKFLNTTLGVYGLRSYLNNITWKGRTLDVVKGVTFNVDDLRKEYPDLIVEKFQNEQGKILIAREAVTGEHFISPAMEAVWAYVDDLDKGMMQRVRHNMWIHISDSNYSGRRYSKCSGLSYVFRAKGLTPKKLTAVLKGFPVDSTSSLEEPPKSVAAKKIVRLRRLVEGGYWQETDVDLNDGGYFIRLNYESPVDIPNVTALCSVVSSAKQLGLIPANVKIYGIPRSRKTLENRDNWVDLVATLKADTERLLAEEAIAVAEYVGWEEVREHDIVRFLSRVVSTDVFLQSGFAAKIGSQVKEVVGLSERVRFIVQLARQLEVEVSQEATQDGRALVGKFLTEYPMLEVITGLTQRHGRNYALALFEGKMIEYISLVDKSKEDERKSEQALTDQDAAP